MDGVKFYCLCNNFVRKIFIEKLKKYMKEEFESYLFMHDLLF